MRNLTGNEEKMMAMISNGCHVSLLSSARRMNRVPGSATDAHGAGRLTPSKHFPTLIFGYFLEFFTCSTSSFPILSPSLRFFEMLESNQRNLNVN